MRGICPTTVLLASLVLAGCGGGGGGGAAPTPPPVCVDPCGITVTWNANPEQAVNQAGGGYRVYSSLSPNTPLGDATLVTVPFDLVTGSTPTSASLQLTAGTWYVRVTAFSALNSLGSAPSQAMAVAVP